MLHDLWFASFSPLVTGLIVATWMWWLNSRTHKKTREHLAQQDEHLSRQDEALHVIHDKIKPVVRRSTKS